MEHDDATVMPGDTDSCDDPEDPSKVYTVAELGMSLPIGTGPRDGSSPRDQSLEFKDWTGSDERKLTAWRRKRPNLTQPELVVGTLAHFVTRWGQYDFTTKKLEEKEVILSSSTAADVFHAWFLLRIENLGETYDVGMSCQACREEIPFTINLEDIEVTAAAGPDVDLTRVCEGRLRKGVPYRGERHFGVRVKPIEWQVFTKLHKFARQDLSALKMLMIEQCVVGLDGIEGPLKLPQSSIDNMIKRDIEALALHVEAKSYGPDLSLEVTCPSCDANNVRAVRWEYEGFFSGSTSSI